MLRAADTQPNTTVFIANITVYECRAFVMSYAINVIDIYMAVSQVTITLRSCVITLLPHISKRCFATIFNLQTMLKFLFQEKIII